MVIQYPTHMCGLYYFLLFILIQASSCSTEVTGLIGHDVTLPCSYDAKTYGVLNFCWGRGEIPRSKCSKTILSSYDGAVSYRQSPRYQLLGRVAEGELSLTILNAQKSDSGIYGCRVEIPGWFNDHKTNIHLVMKDDQPITQNFPLFTAVTEEIQIAAELEHMRVLNVTLEKIQSATNQEESFLGVGNIGRMAAIFCLTVILILVLVFWRTILSRETQHPNILTTENIYESIAITK